MQKIITAVTITLALILVGCKSAAQPTPTTKPLPSLAATATTEPTSTPTLTPIPEDTPTANAAATFPPTPTDTPTLTPTPEDTPTAVTAATATPTVELTSIEAIAANQAGQEVSVEGEVIDTASFSQGFKFTLDDGTGQITLLMWHNVYDDCWDAAEINLGAIVQASGKIGQYKGELQVEPEFGGDVKAIEGASAQAASREIGSLSGDDEGQRVMIEGQVIRVDSGGSWSKVFIGDESGEILVFLYHNILNRVPDNTALGTPGSRVRVVGAVEVYENNLEIIPSLPYDVVVLKKP